MNDQRDKNAVFSAGGQQPGGHRGDSLIDVPIDTVPLPSNGIVYPVGSSLHGVETLDIKAMTSTEEDILTSAAFAKKGIILTELIRSCLLDKSIDPASLLTGDRYALLLAIRITGYGHLYTDDVTCSDCGKTTKRTFDMTTFPIRRLTLKPESEGTNRFVFQLPLSKKTVTFRFLTGHDEQDMHVAEQRMKKLGINAEANVTSNLIRQIISVDGVEDPGRVAMFAKNMRAADSLALRKFISENQPGIILKQELTCPACEFVEEVDMPMGLGFLWPAAAR
jgi:hypothetical protein